MAKAEMKMLDSMAKAKVNAKVNAERVNASTVYAMTNDLQPRNIKSVDFGFELLISLIRPHIERPRLIGINSSVVRKIEIVLGKKISSKHVKTSSGFFPHQSEKRRRCDACISKIKGKGAKEKKTKFLSN